MYGHAVGLRAVGSDKPWCCVGTYRLQSVQGVLGEHGIALSRKG
jgi:hypothetical protein